MQLKRKRSIRAALAAASSGVLGLTSNSPVVHAAGWDVNSSVLSYAEKDRVSVVEPVINIHGALAKEENVDVRLVLDTMTGASANGAVPNNKDGGGNPLSFTSPSGESNYRPKAGETPLDPSFRDTRGAINVAWEKPLARRLKAVFSANLSLEFDYRALGLSAAFTQDINARNTSLSAAFSVGNDQIKAVGGTPVAGNPMPGNSELSKTVISERETKRLYDVMLGVTQVFSRRTLGQLNYSYAINNGYLTDPYKVVSVVTSDGNSRIENIYESRPDRRVKKSWYAKLVHQFRDDVVNLSYRYFWDDWGIVSHTLDFHYRYEINPKYYLQPHLRYYRQSAADFYRYFIVGGESPKFVSADYRLGDMTTSTIGIRFARVYSKASELSMRIEWIRQSGESHPTEAIGKLQKLDLFPDVTAFVFQVGYSIDF